MKINSIGIDTYRQAMEKPQTENRLNAEKDSKAAEASKVHIPSQTEKIGSKLGVKLKPGTFIDMLSQEEKEAPHYSLSLHLCHRGCGGRAAALCL